MIAYKPVFGAGYIFDDHILIEKNPAIRNIANVPLFFVSKEARIPFDYSGLQNDIFRPIQSVSYAISYRFWGGDPRPYHFENVILHILSGFMVYLMMRLITDGRGVASVTALFFLIHPVQVEAVAYLAERANLLSTFFFFLSFIIFVVAQEKPISISRILNSVSLVFFALSVLSKESSIVLPVIIFLYSLLFKPCGEKSGMVCGHAWPTALRKSLPYFILALIYLFTRTASLGKLAQIGGGGAAVPPVIIARIFSEYLSVFFFPVRLTFFRNFYIPFNIPPAQALIFLAVFIIFFWITMTALLKNRTMGFFLACYLASLLPVSNIIPIKSLIQERFFYLPSVFLAASLVYGVSLIFFKYRQTVNKRFAMVFLIAVVILISIALITRTYIRCLDWKDQETFVRKEMSIHPDKGVFYYDIGNSLFMASRYDEAIPYLKEALKREMSPIHMTMTLDTLGNCYSQKGDVPSAEIQYRKALDITPDYVYSLNSIGNIMFAKGAYKEARDYFGMAYKAWPDSEVFSKNLGSAYMMLGDKESAIKYWRRSLKLNPGQSDVAGFVERAESGSFFKD